jgi:hypothetical protein
MIRFAITSLAPDKPCAGLYVRNVFANKRKHKTKTASERGSSRKPRGSELERGAVRTGSSSVPPQVDLIIGPFRTNRPGCSCSSTACAALKGRRPEVQLVELVLEQLPELTAGQLERQQELLFHKNQLCNPLSSQRRCNHRSNRRQSRNHNFAEPAQLHGEHGGRSQPEHMSEQRQRMGCSSTCCVEPDHRFRQQLRGELVRLCRSDHRRRRS